MKHGHARLPGGLRMHWLEAGEGPDVALLLHGFPELSISWRAQLEGLSERYRVVAPDLRGYGQTDAPRGRGRYLAARLSRDVVELMAVIGARRVHLVGHDWGGGVAWDLAQRFPSTVRTLSVLNCPHPRVFTLRLLESLAQLRRSWYMFFFQLPWLPELALGRQDPMQLAKATFYGGAVNRAPFDEAMLAPYAKAFRRGVHGGINYYRATVLGAQLARPIAAPTQLIWGTGDPFLGIEMTEPRRYRRLVRSFRVVHVDGAGHWVQQEAPEVVNERLASFWSEYCA